MKMSPALVELVKSDDEEFERQSIGDCFKEGSKNIEQIPPRRARQQSPFESASQSKLKANPFSGDITKNTSAIAPVYNRSVYVPLDDIGQHPQSRQNHRKNQISEMHTMIKPLIQQSQIIMKMTVGSNISQSSTFFRRDLNRMKKLQFNTMGEMKKGLASRSVQKESRHRINRANTQNESTKLPEEVETMAPSGFQLRCQDSKLQ